MLVGEGKANVQQTFEFRILCEVLGGIGKMPALFTGGCNQLQMLLDGRWWWGELL